MACASTETIPHFRMEQSNDHHAYLKWCMRPNPPSQGRFRRGDALARCGNVAHPAQPAQPRPPSARRDLGRGTVRSLMRPSPPSRGRLRKGDTRSIKAAFCEAWRGRSRGPARSAGASDDALPVVADVFKHPTGRRWPKQKRPARDGTCCALRSALRHDPELKQTGPQMGPCCALRSVLRQEPIPPN